MKTLKFIKRHGPYPIPKCPVEAGCYHCNKYIGANSWDCEVMKDWDNPQFFGYIYELLSQVEEASETN